jgi:hypothetical protein
MKFFFAVLLFACVMVVLATEPQIPPVPPSDGYDFKCDVTSRSPSAYNVKKASNALKEKKTPDNAAEKCAYTGYTKDIVSGLMDRPKEIYKDSGLSSSGRRGIPHRLTV